MRRNVEFGTVTWPTRARRTIAIRSGRPILAHHPTSLLQYVSHTPLRDGEEVLRGELMYIDQMQATSFWRGEEPSAAGMETGVNLLSTIFLDLSDRVVNFVEMQFEDAFVREDSPAFHVVELSATDEGVVS